MNAKRTSWLLTGLLGLLLLAIPASTYGLQQLLTTESDALLQQKAKLAALQQQQTDLARAKAQIRANAELYEITKSIVPQNKDQAQAVRQIVNLAQKNRVSLQSITFPASTLGSGARPGATVNANAATTKLSQLTPVKNIPGVYTLQLTVTSDPQNPVRFEQLIAFLADLEKNRQTALVSNLNISPSKSSDSLSFSLTLDTFIKP